MRSRDIYGPYERCPHNPVLSNVTLHRYSIQAIGHADLVEDARGGWWAVCLGIRLLDTQLRHNLGRETFLAPVQWENDWPVSCDGGVHLEMSGPLPGRPEPQNHDIKDGFSGRRLSLHWNYLRNPDLSRYRLEKGCLVLAGGADGLSDKQPVFVGVRQQSFNIESITKLRGNMDCGTRGGITAFLNESYHYDLAIEKRQDGLYVLVNRRVHDFEAISFQARLSADITEVDIAEVELRIKADTGWYYFDYRPDKGEWRSAGKAMTAGLCSEGTHSGCFTGVYIGLYSSGAESCFKGFSLANLRQNT
jgi:alpha-N-arabinofuranosidase